MTTDLEADLRREFDAARPPSTLTFSPDSVLRQGSRTIRRRRIIAAGSTAMAVGLVVVGSTLMNGPHNSAAPQPATHTATTGNFSGQFGWPMGTFQVDFRLDAGVASNMHYNVVTPDGKRHDLADSRGKPGLADLTPDAFWGSGTIAGHPVAAGLVPKKGNNVTVTFTNGVASFGPATSEVDGTGYTMFAVAYPATAGPVNVASIRWSAPSGIVDGIEGDHRLTGRVLDLGRGVSLEVVLRPSIGGRTTVFGQSRTQTSGGGASNDLTAATTDPFGVAVVTGDQQLLRKVKGGTEFIDGPPVAAGILPPGASDIGWVLSTGADASPVVVSDRMPDGTVIFAMKVPSAQESSLVKATVKAVTWTNADGSHGTATATPRPSTSPATTTASAPTATAPTSTAPTSGLPGTPACQFGVPGANVPGLRPALIFIGCATSANNLQHISWSTWTATGATGSATHGINDCKPSCAQGTYTYFPVNVRLSNPGRLNGMLVFKTIAMSPTSKVGRPETATEHDPPNGIWGWSCSSAASLCSPR